MDVVVVVAVIVLVLAIVQIRRRGSRLMRADNAPPRKEHSGDGGPLTG